MQGCGVELLVVVLCDDQGALRPGNSLENITPNYSKIYNLANSWDEKALRVRFEMLNIFGIFVLEHYMGQSKQITLIIPVLS